VIVSYIFAIREIAMARPRCFCRMLWPKAQAEIEV